MNQNAAAVKSFDDGLAVSLLHQLGESLDCIWNHFENHVAVGLEQHVVLAAVTDAAYGSAANGFFFGDLPFRLSENETCKYSSLLCFGRVGTAFALALFGPVCHSEAGRFITVCTSLSVKGHIG